MRRSYSFIELILVLSLFSLLASVLGFSFPKAFEKQKRQLESQAFEQFLQTCYDEVLFLEEDCTLKFSYQDQKLILTKLPLSLTQEQKPLKQKVFYHLPALTFYDDQEKKVDCKLSSKETKAYYIHLSYNGGFQSPKWIKMEFKKSPASYYLLTSYPHVLEKKAALYSS